MADVMVYGREIRVVTDAWVAPTKDRHENPTVVLVIKSCDCDGRSRNVTFSMSPEDAVVMAEAIVEAANKSGSADAKEGS
jgi:hypothetical protein